MGKKKATNKPTSSKQPSATSEKRPDNHTPVEARPPSPQQSQPTPTPQAPAMVPLDALAAYLRKQDPNKDWTATLAGFSQTRGGTSVTGGMPAIPTLTPEIPTTVNPPTTVPTSSTPTPKKLSPTVTAPSASSKPSPIHQQIEPLDVSPLSAYQDRYLGETEEKESEGGKKKSEETPVAKPIPQEKERDEIDVNETARKQGLMTDEEFQWLLDGVNRMEVDTAEMAEGLNLASKAVEGGEASGIVNESEVVVHQSAEGVDEKQTEEERPKPVTPQSEAGEDDEQTQ